MSDIALFRRARRADVEAIVQLLAANSTGASREDLGPPLPAAYFDAFAAIDADPTTSSSSASARVASSRPCTSPTCPS